MWGKNADEIGGELGEGWIRGAYGSKKDGWKFMKGDKLIAYHPEGGRHVESYYKISSSKGRIKVVDSNYILGLREKAYIIYYFGGRHG